MIKRILNNKFINLIFYVSLCISMIFMEGCQNAQGGKEKTSGTLSIALEKGQIEDLDDIKIILDNFKKSHENYTVTIIEEDDFKNIKQDIIDKKYDIVISSRNTFLTLNENGLIKDLTSYFNQNKSQSKFYDIVYAYGKVGDKNLGMGLIPSSIEILYNKNKLSDILKENNALSSLKSMITNEKLKIPYILPEDLNINLALSSIVSNNLIKENNLISIYNGDENKYLDVIDITDMFKLLNTLSKDYGLKGNKFIKSDISVLESLNNGEIPFAITTSEIAKSLDYSNIESLSNLGINDYKVTPPILSRYTVYATSSSENLQGINTFFDYMISDDTYIPLADKGVITGNKKADSNFKGLNKMFLISISKGSINNIPYYLNLPENFLKPLNAKLKDIIDYGSYNENYWKDIVYEVFK
ncbi:MAG: extracellular solute-binding protein [Clostridium perfringens]|nr:extracellular solute-binding protein [Clostridium perfringens]